MSKGLIKIAATINNRRGQITLVALLLGVLGLTVGLSVVSRSLSDLKQASFVDFGTKALAAAEAGAEYGLNLASTSPGTSDCTVTNGVPVWHQIYPTNTDPNAQALTFSPGLNLQTVGYLICTDVGGYAFSNQQINQDDVFQVVLNTGATGTNSVNIYWTAASGIEVAVLYPPGGSHPNSYTVQRFTYGPSTFNGGTTNLSPTANATTRSATGYCPIPSQFSGVNQLVQSGGAIPLTQGGVNATLMRVTPIIGGPAYIQVCPSSSGQNQIPGQFTTVIGMARTTNNTTKVISVRRDLNGYLPSIFDNVIFSGGSLTK